MKITYKKMNSWDNQSIYHAITDKLTVPFTVTTKSDRIGQLKLVECSLTGDFEVYGMDSVKSKIRAAIEIKLNITK